MTGNDFWWLAMASPYDCICDKLWWLRMALPYDCICQDLPGLAMTWNDWQYLVVICDGIAIWPHLPGLARTCNDLEWLAITCGDLRWHCHMTAVVTTCGDLQWHQHMTPFAMTCRDLPWLAITGHYLWWFAMASSYDRIHDDLWWCAIAFPHDRICDDLWWLAMTMEWLAMTCDDWQCHCHLATFAMPSHPQVIPRSSHGHPHVIPSHPRPWRSAPVVGEPTPRKGCNKVIKYLDRPSILSRSKMVGHHTA